MAQKRMFSNLVIGSDDFLEMPESSQNLYFHLSMQADDDGFIDNWKSIMRMTGKKEDDLKILVAKSFVIPFESGLLVIRHWKLNNYIQKDRYKETIHKEEKALLSTDISNVYNLDTDCIQNVSSDKNRLDKNRLDESSIDNIPASEERSSSASVKANKHKYGEYKNVLLKDEELQKLKDEYKNWEELISYLDEYIEMKGYKAKSHYLCIKKWVIDAVKKNNTKKVNKSNYERREYNNLDFLYANMKQEESDNK